MYTYLYWSYTNENFRTKFAEWYQTAAPRPYVGILLGYGILIISLSAIGQSVVFRIANGSADVISGNADYVTITRVGEYVISISSEHNLIAFSFGNDKG